jgi:hypothetical protein
MPLFLFTSSRLETVRRSTCCRQTPAFAGDDTSMCLGINAKTDSSNTFAPEGASRCRALTSGLQDRAAVEKNVFSMIGWG